MVDKSSLYAVSDSPTASATRVRGAGASRINIILVATRMFAENGFVGTSVRDIAQACGLTLPSIYHHFGDKETLYNQCVDTSLGAGTRKLTDALTSGATAEARMQQFTVALCDLLLNDECLRLLLQRAMIGRGKHGVEGLIDYFPEQFAQVTEEIRQLGCTDAPAEQAFALYALAFGMVQLGYLNRRIGLDPERFGTPTGLADYLLQTVLPQLKR